ncbi:hypothetical protein F443_21487 [Phytophthora nicotianae P1569]|uniref:SWIM-type domain-containing protein n=1 Tax=Phytophthora nicotianae P1569 TaxID=1317065 RepID=V9DY21_PHYNI|nr:hypothetical protein F443_21487 [Phytophthora nicotianae P1569]
MVQVTGFDVAHNHNVSESTYNNHASNRRVEDPDVLAFVDELQAAGSKPKLIVQYRPKKKTGKHVTLRDKRNMVTKLKEKRKGGATTEERLETVLQELCETRGNRATVFVDDNKTAKTITMQTRQMRRWFKVFSEILLVDATHNTNESRYKLFWFMVNDVYGHCQYVHHSLMENESNECLSDAIRSFKFNNPSWEKIKVIVIDKDLGELELLEKEFERCEGHSYIRTEMAKSEYGGPTSFDKDEVEDAVDMMRLVLTAVEYTKYLKYLYFLLDDVHLKDSDAIPEPGHPFLKYFMRNWDSMKERWALYARSDVPHLGNHTNNRLESSWGHLKEVLKPEMALDECVNSLMFLQTVAEMDYAKRITEVGQMRYDGADEQLKKLVREVSPHAHRMVEQQYRVAVDRKTHYEQEQINSQLYLLRGTDESSSAFHVNTARYRCSCVFMKTTLLPCRHVRYWRLMNDKSAVPIHYIEPRWKLSSKLNQAPFEEDVPDEIFACTTFQMRESAMTGRRHEVLNGSTKYKHALERGRSIADIMSRNETFVFGEMMNALEKFEEIVKDGAVHLSDVKATGSTRYRSWRRWSFCRII